MNEWMSHLIPSPMCSKTLDSETSFAWKGFLFSLNSCARQIRHPSLGTPYPISLETYLLMRSAEDCSPHSEVILAANGELKSMYEWVAGKKTLVITNQGICHHQLFVNGVKSVTVEQKHWGAIIWVELQGVIPVEWNRFSDWQALNTCREIIASLSRRSQCHYNKIIIHKRPL